MAEAKNAPPPPAPDALWDSSRTGQKQNFVNLSVNSKFKWAHVIKPLFGCLKLSKRTLKNEVYRRPRIRCGRGHKQLASQHRLESAKICGIPYNVKYPL